MTETPDTTPAAESADDGLDLPQNLDQARKLRSENRISANGSTPLRPLPPRQAPTWATCAAPRWNDSPVAS